MITCIRGFKSWRYKVNKLVIISAETIIHLLYMIIAIFLLLNKRTFRPNSGPRFTRIIALAQNQLSKSLVQTCYVSHSRQSLFAESRIAYALSSAHRFSNRTCLKEQPTGDLKTVATDSWLENENRSNRQTTRHSVYQLLCSCSSSVLFHTNSICECVILNYNYRTGRPIS